MADSDTKKESGGNTLLFVFSEKDMTPGEVEKMKESIRQSQIEDEKRIQKYRDLIQKDIVSLFDENYTPGELEKYGYITVGNIRTALYDRITGRYSEECVQELDFFSSDILKIMKEDGLLESKWFPYHGGGQDPEELSYKLSEKGVELLKSYLEEEKKDEKHNDALEVLNPF